MTETVRIVDVTLAEAADLKAYLEVEFRRSQGGHDIEIALITEDQLPSGLGSAIPPELILKFPEIARHFEDGMAQAAGGLTATFAIKEITRWIKQRRPKTDAKIVLGHEPAADAEALPGSRPATETDAEIIVPGGEPKIAEPKKAGEG